MFRPFRCYRQLEHSDCGLTCIRMVARHFGKKVPIRFLQEITDLNRLGMSLKDITDCCREIGLNAVSLKIGIEHARRMPLPAIVYWKQRHFVVLYRITERRGRYRYHVADPAEGKVVYDEREFTEGWIPRGEERGLVVLAEPDDGFESKSFPKSNVLKSFRRYLLSFFKGYRKTFAWTLLITLVVMAADFAMPLLLRRTVDDGISSKDFNIVLALLAAQLAGALGELVSPHGRNCLLTRSGLRMNLEMTDNFLSRLARFPISFFDRKVSSDFVQKIGDQSRIRDFLMSFPNAVLIMALNFIVFSTLLFHYSPLIFSIIIVGSLIEIGWNALFLSRRKSIDMAMFSAHSENRNHAYELTNGMADLKVNNAENARIEKWRETQRRLNDTSMRSQKLSIFQNSGHTLLSRLKEFSVTGVSALLVIQGDMTFGIMMTLAYITGRLAQPFSQISSSITSLQDAVISYQRIDDVINNESEFRGERTFSRPSIKLSDVWFKYAGSSSPYVIRGLSMEVMPGTVTALVGESGCGKSTLIKLMLGFYIPQKGSIYLSGNDIREMNPQDWMAHCGVVMQEGKIFTGSILENICLGADDNDETDRESGREHVRELLRIVGLDTFVSSLPMGLSTQLGVSGIELSGGQKQRLMIARALYKNPDILFMDEATSSLDANNERSIVDNIRNFGRGKTVIIAAHRLSTVQNADNIIYIKNGEIVEQGTHQQLIKQRGDYRRLVYNQLQLSV